MSFTGTHLWRQSARKVLLESRVGNLAEISLASKHHKNSDNNLVHSLARLRLAYFMLRLLIAECSKVQTGFQIPPEALTITHTVHILYINRDAQRIYAPAPNNCITENFSFFCH